MELLEVTYDRAIGAGYARLGTGTAMRTENYKDRVLVDYDESDRVLGVEVIAPMATIPVDDMQTHFDWDNSTWACVQIAARRLESLMEAPASSGSDGVFRLPTMWVKAQRHANHRPLEAV